jgi:hypothetical protein
VKLRWRRSNQIALRRLQSSERRNSAAASWPVRCSGDVSHRLPPGCGPKAAESHQRDLMLTEHSVICAHCQLLKAIRQKLAVMHIAFVAAIKLIITSSWQSGHVRCKGAWHWRAGGRRKGKMRLCGQSAGNMPARRTKSACSLLAEPVVIYMSQAVTTSCSSHCRPRGSDFAGSAFCTCGPL